MSQINHDKIDHLLLKKISLCYNIAVNDLDFIVAMDNNFVYSFQKGSKKYFLRGGLRHSTEEILAELEWILFLNSQGVKVALPILSKNNRYLEYIEFENKRYKVVVFESAPGKQADPANPDEWNEDLWEEMGRTLGRMHSAAVIYNSKELKYKRDDALNNNLITAKKTLDPKKDKKIINKLYALVKKLDLLPKELKAYGLIQYDFHCENFNVHNGEITVFDFDDSYYFFFFYDLAACIHEAVWDNPDDKKLDFANRFIPSLWKGYSSVFQLDRKWIDYLPDFLKWREFDIYITLVESFHDKSAPENFLHRIEEIMLEFRERIESNKQIIPLPKNLDIWFQEI
ncbi:MAG: phosphotransferase [Asgard group archaeon]|nr:phosphotransferase [Asgard group archaeon]